MRRQRQEEVVWVEVTGAHVDSVWYTEVIGQVFEVYDVYMGCWLLTEDVDEGKDFHRGIWKVDGRVLTAEEVALLSSG